MNKIKVASMLSHNAIDDCKMLEFGATLKIIDSRVPVRGRSHVSIILYLQLKLPKINTTTVYGRSGAYLDSTYVERAPSDRDSSRNMNTSSEWWVIV